MIPSTRARYIGIEIEFYSPYSDLDLPDYLRRFCRLGYDNSIETTEGEGRELRILSKVTDLDNNLSKVQAWLTTVNAKVNNSCGLHVHLDMRSFDFNIAYSNLISRQDQMFRSVCNSRKANRFCRFTKLNKKQIAMVNAISLLPAAVSVDIDDDDLFDNHKYHAISLNPIITREYKTIEVRLHEGTVDCSKIYDWCKYLSDIAYSNKLTKKSLTYIKKRIAKNG